MTVFLLQNRRRFYLVLILLFSYMSTSAQNKDLLYANSGVAIQVGTTGPVFSPGFALGVDWQRLLTSRICLSTGVEHYTFRPNQASLDKNISEVAYGSVTDMSGIKGRYIMCNTLYSGIKVIAYNNPENGSGLDFPIRVGMTHVFNTGYSFLKISDGWGAIYPDNEGIQEAKSSKLAFYKSIGFCERIHIYKRWKMTLEGSFSHFLIRTNIFYSNRGYKFKELSPVHYSIIQFKAGIGCLF